MYTYYDGTVMYRVIQMAVALFTYGQCILLGESEGIVYFMMWFHDASIKTHSLRQAKDKQQKTWY